MRRATRRITSSVASSAQWTSSITTIVDPPRRSSSMSAVATAYGTGSPRRRSARASPVLGRDVVERAERLRRQERVAHPPEDAHVPGPAGAELLQQRRLPGTCLAGDHRHAAVPCCRLGECRFQRGQLALALGQLGGLELLLDGQWHAPHRDPRPAPPQAPLADDLPVVEDAETTGGRDRLAARARLQLPEDRRDTDGPRFAARRRAAPRRRRCEGPRR